MTTDNCVVCGIPVPEGRQVCPECTERAAKKKTHEPVPSPKEISIKRRRRF